MTNLLPFEEKKAVRGIYTVRRFIVALSLVVTGIIVGAIFLLPSFFIIAVKEQRLSEELAGMKKESTPDTNKQIEQAITEANKTMDILKLSDGSALSEAMLATFSVKDSDISFTGFFYTKETSDTSPRKQLVIRGKAATRNALITFVDRLKSERVFASADLPVSDLAQAKDLTFSITTVLAIPKK